MTLALPSTHDEAWRWSDLAALPALAEAEPTGGVIDVSDLWIGSGPRLLFVDGKLDPVISAPSGIGFGPVTPSSHALGRLATGDGWTLALGRDHAAPATIEIVHVATGGANHLPARIALDEDAQASIVETFIGDGWANRFTRIELGHGARLMRSVRLLQASGFASLREEAALGTGASLVTVLLGAGGAGTRIDAQVTLGEPGGFAEYGGALLSREEQRHDVNVVVRHAAEGGTSRQLWRAVAQDTATASIAARVEVARGAQKTDGEQSLRGLLLKRTATINLKPELEIFADDVQCGHGATSGALDDDLKFYLMARGIPESEAEALLVQAFVGEAIEGIEHAGLRDALMEHVVAWLKARGS